MGLSDIIKTLDAKKCELYILSEDDLANLKKTYIEMLDDVQKVCKKHNINWILTAGSMLGTVRHGGFIPWDDDIDLNMTRENYDKFSDVFEKELSEKYILNRPGDKGYLLHFPTIEKKNTCIQQIQSIDGVNNGVAMDIFIMENTYDSKFLRFFHGMWANFLLFVDTVVRVKACSKNFEKYSQYSEELAGAYKKRVMFAKLFSFKSMEDWMRISDKHFKSIKNNNTEYIVVPSGRRHYFGEIFLRNKMTETVPAKFENIDVNIPKDYGYYLTLRYGEDYMIPPKEGKRERHAVIKFHL